MRELFVQNCGTLHVYTDLQNMTFASATWGDRVGQTLALCLNGSTMAVGAPNTTTRAGVKKDGYVSGLVLYC